MASLGDNELKHAFRIATARWGQWINERNFIDDVFEYIYRKVNIWKSKILWVMINLDNGKANMRTNYTDTQVPWRIKASRGWPVLFKSHQMGTCVTVHLISLVNPIVRQLQPRVLDELSIIDFENPTVFPRRNSDVKGVSRGLKSPTDRLFVKQLTTADNKENIIDLHCWPFERGTHRSRSHIIYICISYHS